MTLTRERIEGLAPDQASLAAALKLVKPATWPVLAANADASLIWGECQGSGSTPYRVVVSTGDAGYKCTCPSRKFPCKHVLAVMWLHVDKPARFESGTVPPWAEEWLSRRRPGGGRPAVAPPKADEAEGAPAPSLAAAMAEPEAPAKAVDPKAAARTEAQRQRLKAEREAAVRSGLDELDRWTLDQLNQGVATFAGRSDAATRTLSARLVDAKAGALAGRLDRLSTALFQLPEAQRADAAIEQLGLVTLIAAAYRNQDRLPPLLKEDVRRAVGWTQKREELLSDPSALRVTSAWFVAANRSEVQPDKLLRLETWLLNTAPAEGQPLVAALMDFIPVAMGRSSGFPFAAGETITGEAVFFPSAAPLRAVMATTKADPAATAWPAGHEGIAPALAEHAARLAALPWLDEWPLVIRGTEIRTSGEGRLVIADRTGLAVPIEPSDRDALMPLMGLENLAVLGLWDGRALRPLAAKTPIGVWHHG